MLTVLFLHRLMCRLDGPMQCEFFRLSIFYSLSLSPVVRVTEIICCLDFFWETEAEKKLRNAIL